MSSQSDVYATTWLGQPALALESQTLTLVTVPGMGAKIVSLFHKQAAREWLLPPINRAFEPVPYGARFVDQDMSGWDEMFPTISACAYPDSGAFAGVPLPDHGEVWALAWQEDEVTDTLIRLKTYGHALPYSFTRTISVLDDHMLRLEFEVVNTGSEPFAGLWAAHPQFRVDENTRIVLPASVKHVINVHASAEWKERGQAYGWSRALSSNGLWVALDRIGPVERQTCRKFYVPPDAPVSWAALQQDSDGNWLRLSWDKTDVRYLGIWVDEGTYNAAPTTALEPSTGYYDSLAVAVQHGRIMQFLPGEPHRWHLDVSVGSGAL